jgi:hypothetical protein
VLPFWAVLPSWVAGATSAPTAPPLPYRRIDRATLDPRPNGEAVVSGRTFHGRLPWPWLRA